MSFEQHDNPERKDSFQRPIRRYFKMLDNLDDETYYDFYSETQKIFQHELGLSYEDWIIHDEAADFRLLNKLGLPSQNEYEQDAGTSLCQAANMTISLLGPLVESRVRTFDESWEAFNSSDSETKEDDIDIRDLGVWYLNASRGAMNIYENHSDHNLRCVNGDQIVECSDTENCPVNKLYDQLTIRSVYDGDSQSFLEIDEEVGLEIYRQKMHTAHELGLITKAQLDNSQRWTK